MNFDMNENILEILHEDDRVRMYKCIPFYVYMYVLYDQTIAISIPYGIHMFWLLFVTLVVILFLFWFYLMLMLFLLPS